VCPFQLRAISIISTWNFMIASIGSGSPKP
jgi:hypothetical protein